MSSVETSPQAPVYGPVGPEDAAILGADPLDKTSANAVIDKIGAPNNDPSAVALVTDEHGQPSHFISLAEGDEGTRLKEQTRIKEGLPSPQEAHATLTAQAPGEAAAVRPESQSPIVTEVDRQMGIAAADRVNREQAGLKPRPFDLR